MRVLSPDERPACTRPQPGRLACRAATGFYAGGYTHRAQPSSACRPATGTTAVLSRRAGVSCVPDSSTGRHCRWRSPAPAGTTGRGRACPDHHTGRDQVLPRRAGTTVGVTPAAPASGRDAGMVAAGSDLFRSGSGTNNHAHRAGCPVAFHRLGIELLWPTRR